MDDLVEVLEAFDTRMPAGDDASAVEVLCEHPVKNVVDEGRLTRSGHSCHGCEKAERHRHIHALKVVFARIHDLQHTTGIHLPALFRHIDRALATQVLPGDRAGLLEEPLVRAGVGADIDDPVGRAERVLIVLDNDEGIAEVAKPNEGVDEPLVIALVEPD